MHFRALVEKQGVTCDTQTVREPAGDLAKEHCPHAGGGLSPPGPGLVLRADKGNVGLCRPKSPPRVPYMPLSGHEGGGEVYFPGSLFKQTDRTYLAMTSWARRVLGQAGSLPCAGCRLRAQTGHRTHSITNSTFGIWHTLLASGTHPPEWPPQPEVTQPKQATVWGGQPPPGSLESRESCELRCPLAVAWLSCTGTTSPMPGTVTGAQ